jgi:hypothetical protein
MFSNSFNSSGEESPKILSIVESLSFSIPKSSKILSPVGMNKEKSSFLFIPVMEVL